MLLRNWEAPVLLLTCGALERRVPTTGAGTNADAVGLVTLVRTRAGRLMEGGFALAGGG